MGHRAVVLDDLSGGRRDNLNFSALFVQGTILDSELINDMFEDYRFDYVFHLAAYTAERLSHFIKRFNYNNNLIGSVNVINAAINIGSVKCFVYTSSMAVYGKNQVPMSDEMVPAPKDPYGIAKYAVEQDLHEAYEMFGLPFVVFRPDNVYGERQNIGDKYRNVVGIFMNQAMHGEPLTIFGDGEQIRAFSYIDDVAPVIAESCNRPQGFYQSFNIGASMQVTVNQLARVVSEAMGKKQEVRHLEAPNEVVDAFCSHDKVRKFYGDLIKDVPLEEGIRKMAIWIKRIGPQVGRVFKNIEVRKNMPASWAEITDDL